jgi:hypothetical protein
MPLIERVNVDFTGSPKLVDKFYFNVFLYYTK